MSRPFQLIFLFFSSFDLGLSEKCPDRQMSAEAALRERIFCNYNTNIRPVKYFANQTTVHIELHPQKIFMDEFEESITIHGNIQYVWMDDYLQWDPREYEDIKFISVMSHEIWTPDIAVTSTVDGMKLESDAGDCLVSHVGKVLCYPINTINAYCSSDLLRYPFDKQDCSLILLSPSYSGNHLNLNIFGTGVKMSSYRPSNVWDILEISLTRHAAHYGIDDNSTFYPYLKCDVILQRHSAGHQVIIILPGLVLAGLTLLTFLMSDMHQSRMTVSSVTFMSNVFYCLYFGRQLPSNGNEVPLVVTFFRDSLIISGFAIATAVVVHRLERLDCPPGDRLSDLMRRLGVSPIGNLLFLGGARSRGDGGEGEEGEAAEIIRDAKRKPDAWARLATVIDRIMLFICSFIYVILLLVFLP